MIDLSRVPGADLVDRARAAVQPAASPPLEEPLICGAGPLLQAVSSRLTDGDGALDSVIDLVGRGYAITISQDDLRARRLVRTQRVRWRDATQIELTPLSSLIVREAADTLLGRLPPLRAARWVIERRVGDVAARAATAVGDHLTGGPLVLTAVRGKRGDVELDGLLSLTPMVASAVTDTVLAIAEDRGIPVTTLLRDRAQAVA